MKVTIKDIAREAGVSVSTVSKVLSGKEGNIKISDATRERVLAVAKAMHYMPDYGAQLIRTGRAFTFGISIPSSKRHGFEISHYHSGLLKSIEQRSYAKGYDLLLVNSDSYRKKLNATQIDGMIIIDQLELTEDIIYMAENKKPFVIINNMITDNQYELPTINVDNREGMRLVVNHFLENGHRKLAFIGDISHHVQPEHVVRRDAFIHFLEAAGCKVDPSLILLGFNPAILPEIPEEYSHQNFGYYGMKYLYENRNRDFTGVFCANDIIAIGAMHYLYQKKVRVPEDLSVVGFDDVDFAMHLMPGLTSVYQPLDQMGAAAVDVLIDLIERPEQDRKILKLFSPRLMVRKSVLKLTA